MSSDQGPDREEVAEAPKTPAPPSIGEPVIVEDKDGDQHRAVIAELPAESADSFMIERRGSTISLVAYWRPIPIDPNEAVTGVRYVKGVAPDGTPRTYQKRVTYHPASRVTRLLVAEGETGP